MIWAVQYNCPVANELPRLTKIFHSKALKYLFLYKKNYGTDFSSSSSIKIAAMHTPTKKTIVPNDRPKLTVVRNISSVQKTEIQAVKKNNEKRWVMPEQPSGYIKTRKHDCL